MEQALDACAAALAARIPRLPVEGGVGALMRYYAGMEAQELTLPADSSASAAAAQRAEDDAASDGHSDADVIEMPTAERYWRADEAAQQYMSIQFLRDAGADTDDSDDEREGTGAASQLVEAEPRTLTAGAALEQALPAWAAEGTDGGTAAALRHRARALETQAARNERTLDAMFAIESMSRQGLSENVGIYQDEARRLLGAVAAAAPAPPPSAHVQSLAVLLDEQPAQKETGSEDSSDDGLSDSSGDSADMQDVDASFNDGEMSSSAAEPEGGRSADAAAGTRQHDKHRSLPTQAKTRASNPPELYDPHADDEDEAWVRTIAVGRPAHRGAAVSALPASANRASYDPRASAVPAVAQAFQGGATGGRTRDGSGEDASHHAASAPAPSPAPAEGAPPTSSAAAPMPHTTHVSLTCPGCFTVVAFAAEPHVKHDHQHRAAEALHVRVVWDEVLPGPQPLHRVACANCAAELGVYDALEEAYHFVHALPGPALQPA